MGSGAPSSSRTNITSLFPSNPYNAVGDSHMGGNFAAQLKYAGYDAIIIEGKSNKPVWLKIDNDKVSLESATSVWGKGIKDTTAQLGAIMGKEASIAAIGQYTFICLQLINKGFRSHYVHIGLAKLPAVLAENDIICKAVIDALLTLGLLILG